MKVNGCLEELKSNGVIPEDSSVVSTNNKIVVVSKSAKTVSRIANLADLQERDDPHDIRYSHNVAWYLGESGAPVVKPCTMQPIIIGDYVVSNFPLLDCDNVDLTAHNAANVFSMIRGIGDALPDVLANIPLRSLEVSEYVVDRIDYLANNPIRQNSRLDTLYRQYYEMQERFPFDELVDDDIALVHGDLKAQNVVSDEQRRLLAIDLDAASIGPRLFDIASWRLRTELGDRAAIEEAADLGRRTATWDEETFRALIGWKAISSMSFTLRYEPPNINESKFDEIYHAALSLGSLATNSK